MMFQKKYLHKLNSAGISPLGLIFLAACGGGGGGGTNTGSGKVYNVTGSVIKGPLSNSLVGLDYNNDGNITGAEPEVRTDADGNYTLPTNNSNYTVIATTDDTTVDTFSGAVLSGVTLKSPQEAKFVTPTTTLMVEANLSADQVASVLGLPDGVDPLIFNPYDPDADVANALAVEKSSYQIINVLTALSSAVEGAGASQTNAFMHALDSVVTVVKIKAVNLNNPDASNADKSLDLTSDTDLALIKVQLETTISGNTNVNTTAFTALVDDTVTAVKNLNAKIDTVADVTSDESKNVFSTTQVLADQIKTALTAETNSSGSGNISFISAAAVDIAANNAAPTNIALSNNIISEATNSLVIGILSTTDSDQTTGVDFTYELIKAFDTDYSSFSIDPLTKELSLLSQPDFEIKNTYNLSILVSDESGKKFSENLTIKVANSNSVDQVEVVQGAFLEFIPENDVAKILLTPLQTNGKPLPGWLTFNPNTQTFSGTPSNVDVGTITIEVNGLTDLGSPTQDTFDITISNKNDPPVINSFILDQTTNEHSTFNFSVSGTFQDPDVDDSLTLSATLDDGYPLPGWLTFNSNTQTFSGTPLNGDVGTKIIKVTATDNLGDQISDTFILAVNNVNDAPKVITLIEDQEIDEDSIFSLTLPSDTFQDVDAGDNLILSATLEDGTALPGWLTFTPSAKQFTGTPLNGDVGTEIIKVTATDNSGLQISDTFDMTIVNINDEPIVVTPLSDVQLTLGNPTVTTPVGNFFDDVDIPFGDSLTFKATLNDGSGLPSWLTFDADLNELKASPTATDVGEIDVLITATDSNEAFVIDRFTYIINTSNSSQNTSPVLINPIGDQLGKSEDIPFSLPLPANTFQDPDVDDSLTLSATLDDGYPLPGWLTFNSNTQTFSGTPLNGDVGTKIIKVTATDNLGDQISDTFILAVNNVNDAPKVITLIEDQEIDEDSIFSLTLPSDTFQDVDAGDNLILSATLEDGTALPGWLTFTPSAKQFTGTPLNGDVGTEIIKVTATDNSGLQISDTFDMTIVNINDEPIVVTPLSDVQLTLGNPTVTTPVGNFFDDVDIPFGDSLTFKATLPDDEALPTWIVFDDVLNELKASPTATDYPNPSGYEEIDVLITATDSNDAFVIDIFSYIIT